MKTRRLLLPFTDGVEMPALDVAVDFAHHLHATLVMTLLVAVVISSTKFFDGAWVVVFLIPLLVLMLLGIRSHYLRVERERTTDLPVHPDEIRHRLIVPLG